MLVGDANWARLELGFYITDRQTDVEVTCCEDILQGTRLIHVVSLKLCCFLVKGGIAHFKYDWPTNP